MNRFPKHLISLLNRTNTAFGSEARLHMPLGNGYRSAQGPPTVSPSSIVLLRTALKSLPHELVSPLHDTAIYNRASMGNTDSQALLCEHTQSWRPFAGGTVLSSISCRTPRWLHNGMFGKTQSAPKSAHEACLATWPCTSVSTTRFFLLDLGFLIVQTSDNFCMLGFEMYCSTTNKLAVDTTRVIKCC